MVPSYCFSFEVICSISVPMDLLKFMQTQEKSFVLKVSALEIYNETVVDLLNRDTGPLRLLDDPEVCKGSETLSQMLKETFLSRPV